MVSAGSDGTVKIWNFSNGSSLKNLLPANKKEQQVDREITSLLCVCEPHAIIIEQVKVEDQDDKVQENEENENNHAEEAKAEKPSFFVAAGWDKRLRIWPDDRQSDEENVRASRDLPNKYLANNAT